MSCFISIQCAASSLLAMRRKGATRLVCRLTIPPGACTQEMWRGLFGPRFSSTHVSSLLRLPVRKSILDLWRPLRLTIAPLASLAVAGRRTPTMPGPRWRVSAWTAAPGKLTTPPARTSSSSAGSGSRAPPSATHDPAQGSFRALVCVLLWHTPPALPLQLRCVVEDC